MHKNIFLILISTVLFSSCSGPAPEAPKTKEDRQKLSFGSLLGAEGLNFGGDKVTGRSVDKGGFVVNRYLWQASLDTLQFIPLVSSDGPGGLLITDWYQPSQARDRLKVQVRIKDTQLHSNALEVNVYKQVKDLSGWRDAGVDIKASRELENIILLKARDIRVKTKER